MYVFKEAVFTGPAMKSESIDKHIDLNFPIDLILFFLCYLHLFVLNFMSDLKATGLWNVAAISITMEISVQV